MNSFDKVIFDKKIYSKLLLQLSRKCPQCGALMTATGYMFFRNKTSHWSIEYWCPEDKEYMNIYTPKTNEIAEEIARDLEA